MAGELLWPLARRETGRAQQGKIVEFPESRSGGQHRSCRRRTRRRGTRAPAWRVGRPTTSGDARRARSGSKRETVSNSETRWSGIKGHVCVPRCVLLFVTLADLVVHMLMHMCMHMCGLPVFYRLEYTHTAVLNEAYQGKCKISRTRH